MSANAGITIGSARFTDFVYADDTTLFCVLQMMHQLKNLSSFSEAAGPFGLQISWAKTKLQNLGSGPVPASISIDMLLSIDVLLSIDMLLSIDVLLSIDMLLSIDVLLSIDMLLSIDSGID